MTNREEQIFQSLKNISRELKYSSTVIMNKVESIMGWFNEHRKRGDSYSQLSFSAEKFLRSSVLIDLNKQGFLKSHQQASEQESPKIRKHISCNGT